MMVPRIAVVSKYNVDPPTDEKDARSIPHGPLYDSTEVVNLLQKSESVHFWTRKCKNDIESYGYDEGDVRDRIIKAVKSGTYRGSVWCIKGPGGVWAACDEYRVRRKEYVHILDREETFEYYVKFALSKSGRILILVSFHV